MAGARRRAEPGGRRTRHAPARRSLRRSCRLGSRSFGPGPDATVPGRRYLERATAPAVRDVPSLSPGHGRRAAGHDCARHGQHHQRDRQLGPHLRQARRAGDGRARGRVGHGPFARGDGGVSPGHNRRARAQPSARPVRDAARDRVVVDTEAAEARRASGVADHARGRCVCRLNGARGTTGADRARRAPDRHSHRRAVIHGPARDFVGRRGARRPRASGAATRPGPRARDGRRWRSARSSWHARPPHSCCFRGC